MTVDDVKSAVRSKLAKSSAAQWATTLFVGVLIVMTQVTANTLVSRIDSNEASVQEIRNLVVVITENVAHQNTLIAVLTAEVVQNDEALRALHMWRDFINERVLPLIRDSQQGG